MYYFIYKLFSRTSPTQLHRIASWRRLRNLRPIPGQLHPKQHIRLHPPVHSSIIRRPPPQLILRKIQIPIRTRTKRIRPGKPRIPHQRRQQPGRRRIHTHRVILNIPQIHIIIGIRLHAIRQALAGQIGLGGARQDLRVRALVAQPRRRHAVQPSAARRREIHGLARGRQRDAVRAEVHVADGRARRAVAVHGLAPDGRHEACGRLHGGDVGQVAPGGAGAEVDGHERVGAFGAGVGDVGDALARGGEGGVEVEADVVQVLWGRDVVSVWIEGSRDGRRG